MATSVSKTEFRNAMARVCALIEARLVGTHNVFIGVVVDIRCRRDGHALLYFDRNYVRGAHDEPSVP